MNKLGDRHALDFIELHLNAQQSVFQHYFNNGTHEMKHKGLLLLKNLLEDGLLFVFTTFNIELW